MQQNTLRNIRITIILFMVALALSGITAFAVETELKWLTMHMQRLPGSLRQFIQYISDSITGANAQFPQMAYGFDWLAFAHLVIALLLCRPAARSGKKHLGQSLGNYGLCCHHPTGIHLRPNTRNPHLLAIDRLFVRSYRNNSPLDGNKVDLTACRVD